MRSRHGRRGLEPYPLDFANRLATAYADAMEILREHARKDEDVVRHLRKLAATATELADLLEKAVDNYG